MRTTPSLRHVITAVLLLVALLCQGTWTLAGTTGTLSGVVAGDNGAPLAGAQVTALSVSQRAVATTDASGHFTFLSLAPDTYTVSANKEGYAPSSIPGVTVFADQSQTLSIHLSTKLKTIAQVRSQSQGSLVKSGTTTDVYAVNAATATQLGTAGGGNNLNSAYSAIYQQPGVVGLPSNFGFGQVFFIHGSSYNQIGYEFDGVPVNRAFDNYNANSLSNLGTQSTEVYTGGGPATATSPTLGGYINQVIKSGSYPGYGSVQVGVGTPGFYHNLDVEAGGATPNRSFSYYAALRGDNMIPLQFDSQNGGDLNPDGNNIYGQQGASWNTLLLPAELFLGSSTRGPWSDCTGGGATAPGNGSYLSPIISGLYGSAGTVAACNVYSPIPATNTIALRGNDLSDRENVVNLHFGIPHKSDAGRDDIQVLYDNFAYQTQSWDNISTFGGLPFMQAMFQPAGTNPDGSGQLQHVCGERARTRRSARYFRPWTGSIPGVCGNVRLLQPVRAVRGFAALRRVRFRGFAGSVLRRLPSRRRRIRAISARSAENRQPLSVSGNQSGARVPVWILAVPGIGYGQQRIHR